MNRRGKGSKRLGRRERSREAVVKARDGGSRRGRGGEERWKLSKTQICQEFGL